jgi:hypothetical protein
MSILFQNIYQTTPLQQDALLSYETTEETLLQRIRRYAETAMEEASSERKVRSSGIIIAATMLSAFSGMWFGGIIGSEISPKLDVGIMTAVAITIAGMLMGGFIGGNIGGISAEAVVGKGENKKIQSFCKTILSKHFATSYKEREEDIDNFKSALAQNRLCNIIVQQLFRCESKPSTTNIPQCLLSLKNSETVPPFFLVQITDLQNQYKKLNDSQKKDLDLLSEEEPTDDSVAKLWKSGRNLAGNIFSRLNEENGGNILWKEFLSAANSY